MNLIGRKKITILIIKPFFLLKKKIGHPLIIINMQSFFIQKFRQFERFSTQLSSLLPRSLLIRKFNNSPISLAQLNETSTDVAKRPTPIIRNPIGAFKGG